MFSDHTLLSLIYKVISIIIGMFGIGFLIGFHELGHFIFCKLFNIRTPSFSIGMGPRLFTKKIGETEFALSLIPLGGYVEIAGAAEVAQGDQKEAHSREQNSFAVKPYYQKMLVMAGGILFNLIFAYAAFSFLYFVGMPKNTILYPLNSSNIISTIEDQSPAQQAGLAVHDTILSLDQTVVSDGVSILTKLQTLEVGQPIVVKVLRDGLEKDISMTVGSRTLGEKEVPFLGVTFEIVCISFIDAIKKGISATNHIIYMIAASFKKLFTGKEINNLGGPLMVISQTIKGAQQGFKIFLLLLAFISINLALLNIIPLPIMDGGQALFYTIEALLRRPLNEKIREYIHYATWIFVILLAVYLSIKDIITLFGLKELYTAASVKLSSFMGS